MSEKESNEKRLEQDKMLQQLFPNLQPETEEAETQSRPAPADAAETEPTVQPEQPIPPKKKHHKSFSETIEFHFGVTKDEDSENDDPNDHAEMMDHKKAAPAQQPKPMAAPPVPPSPEKQQPKGSRPSRIPEPPKMPQKKEKKIKKPAEPKKPKVLTKEEIAKRKHRITLIFVLAICLLAAGLILWLTIPHSGASRYDNNMSGLGEDVMGVRDGYPAAISGTEVTSGNFFSTDRQVLYVSDTSIVRLKDKAKEVYNRSHSFYHPIGRKAGDYVLVYNVGSAGYQIENSGGNVRTETAEASIMAADVAENGKYAIVTETKGYPSYLQVYKPDGSLQYTYSFANCYVTDIALSGDGSHAAVIGVTANEGALISEVYLLNFSSETPETVNRFEGTMLLEAEYCGGRALVVGDNLVASVASNGEQTQFEYGDRKLAAYDFDGERVVVALSPYDISSKGHLTVLNNKAEEICTRACKESFIDVSLYGDTMALLSNDAVYSYSVNAVRNFHSDDEDAQQDAFHVTEASTDAKAVALADESAVYILGISEIRYEDY